MNKHFCTCRVVNCDKHPVNHEAGYDLCIQKNLAASEISAFFWVSVGGDLSNEQDFAVECFVDCFERNRKQYLNRRKGKGDSTMLIRPATARDVAVVSAHDKH